MIGVARGLMGLTLLTAVGFLLTSAWSLDAWSWSAYVGQTSSLARAALADSTWTWLGRLAGGTLVLSALASVLSYLADLTAAKRAPSFEELNPGGSLRQRLDQVAERLELCFELREPDVVAGFQEIIRGAMTLRASDVHLSPTPTGIAITYRIDGALHEVMRAHSALGPRLASRAKVLARLDLQQRGLPQDGRLSLVIAGQPVEARLSSLPTELGERIVLRLVSGSQRLAELGELEFSPTIQQGLMDLLQKPQGLFFVTGPVGSGKTTTLYAALKHIANSRGSTTSLVSLEDPIEVHLPFATQTQISSKTGMTFAATLRSVLRQDPNVLMVGEIRDQETANIATQAGLTGHLILTTVHADHAAGPFARLSELGVEAFTLSGATLGCLSQRLVRRLCRECRRPARAEPAVMKRIAAMGQRVPDGTYYEAVGCKACEGSGHRGRAVIGELLIVTPTLRAAVHDGTLGDELQRLAMEQGMVPLLEDGLRRARAGDISLQDLLVAVG